VGVPVLRKVAVDEPAIWMSLMPPLARVVIVTGLGSRPRIRP
jgi:hypothetical protein